MNYKGSCHCGQISYQVEGSLEQVMECNCSHCSRKGYLLWFVPRSQLNMPTPEEGLATYTFNKHVIKHHFCPKCGCAPFGFGEDPTGVATAAINVRCLENVELSSLEKVLVDGRSF
ncbi:GFA family protein [Methyloglobulus sp.]|uniref:GFA family protein n=1 Tax=Methyloglobulus sp. TaxID=2518622 RepID=UPI003989D3B3